MVFVSGGAGTPPVLWLAGADGRGYGCGVLVELLSVGFVAVEEGGDRDLGGLEFALQSVHPWGFLARR